MNQNCHKAWTHLVLRQIDRNQVIQVISDFLPGRDGWVKGPKQTLSDLPQPKDHLQEGESKPLQ